MNRFSAILSSIVVAVAVFLMAWPVPVTAQEDTARLGGGSDITAGAVIALPSGATLPPLHHVFADNSESVPIVVEFRSDAPAGITVVAEHDRLTIEPGRSAKNHFSVVLDPALAPGDYTVSVQLVRADVVAAPGQITNVPAVGTEFVIRAGGESATINVQALSAQTDQPVDGTLSLTALDGGRSFQIARSEGQPTMPVTVAAPGTYRATYSFDGRELAAQDVSVVPGETATVTLRVDTISFVLVHAEPIEDDGKVVLVDLVASVQNHLQPISDEVTIRAHVRRADGEGQPLDVTLSKLSELPLGVTEARESFRPADGFREGSYVVDFELVTPEYALRASQTAGFDVTNPASVWPTRMAIAVGVSLLVALVLITLVRRRRRIRPDKADGAHGAGEANAVDEAERPRTGATRDPIGLPVPNRYRHDTPEGWYADPTGQPQHRLFDGQDWTEFVMRDGRITSEPVASTNHDTTDFTDITDITD